MVVLGAEFHAESNGAVFKGDYWPRIGGFLAKIPLRPGFQ
ncbi:unnamed protein product, partial [Rotaria sordida]